MGIIEINLIAILAFRSIAATAEHHDVKTNGFFISENKGKVAALIFWKTIVIKSKIMAGVTKYACVPKGGENRIFDTPKVVVNGVATPIIVRLDIEVRAFKLTS